MYTQCPECGIAFKVTANVLKQAAGMVRCGGCGATRSTPSHFLSETMPEQAGGIADARIPAPGARATRNDRNRQHAAREDDFRTNKVPRF